MCEMIIGNSRYAVAAREPLPNSIVEEGVSYARRRRQAGGGGERKGQADYTPYYARRRRQAGGGGERKGQADYKPYYAKREPEPEPEPELELGDQPAHGKI